MKKLVVSILFSGLLALFAAILPTFAALAQSGLPNAHPLMTYGEWNAAWWQWFFSVPASKNPGLLTTEAVDCSVGQTGDVWFLAGHFNGSGSFTHSCTVPGGKTLVIPLINSWADNVCNKPPLTVDQLRDIAANFVTPASNLHARIDNRPLTNLQSNRAISPVFSYTLPPSPDNVLDAVFGVKLPGKCWPSLTVTPAVADGFYIIVPPLSAGTHTINFGGSAGSPLTTLNMTYTLTVGS